MVFVKALASFESRQFQGWFVLLPFMLFFCCIQFFKVPLRFSNKQYPDIQYCKRYLAKNKISLKLTFYK